MMGNMPISEVKGIACALVGGILDNTGVCVQKLSHKLYKDTDVNYWKQKMWLCGITLYLCGTLLNAVALGLAPQSIIAVLGPFTLVYNTINSVFVLKEVITARIIAATCAIMLGSVIAVFTGSRKQQPDVFEIDDFNRHLTSTGFLIYISVVIAILVVMRALIIKHEKIRIANMKVRRPASPQMASTEVGASQSKRSRQRRSKGSAGDLSPYSVAATDEAPAVQVPASRIASFNIALNGFMDEHYLSVAFPIMAGIFASLTALTAKCAIQLVMTATTGYASFSYIETYVLLVIVPIFGFAQVHALNMGMRRFDQLLVIPCFVVTQEITSILGGAIFFKELSLFTASQAFAFFIAILFTIGGVNALAMGRRTIRSTEPLPENDANQVKDVSTNDSDEQTNSNSP